MNKPIDSSTVTSSDPLTEPLRREAEHLAEHFSESLHDRTMRRVRESSIQPAPRPRLLWPYAAVGLAALVALVVTAGLWTHSTTLTGLTGPPAQQKPIARADLGAISDWFDGAAHPVQVTMNTSIHVDALASVDQDMSRFGHFMARQFECLPRQNRSPEIIQR